MLLNGAALNTTALNSEIVLTLADACTMTRERVEKDVRSQIAGVRLDDIDKNALEQARIWRRKYHVLKKQVHEPGWDWKKEYYAGRRRSTHVDLAIWHDTALCGLMIGQVSQGRVNATIHFLESDPEQNPLKGKIADIATRYIEALASLLGCEFAILSNPIPELVDFYKDLGYTIEDLKIKTVKALKKPMSVLNGEDEDVE